MIIIDKNNLLEDGSVFFYTRKILNKGQTIDISYEGKIGYATIVDVSLSYDIEHRLVIADIDWSSLMEVDNQ